jgi:hypothetical protein
VDDDDELLLEELELDGLLLVVVAVVVVVVVVGLLLVVVVVVVVVVVLFFCSKTTCIVTLWSGGTVAVHVPPLGPPLQSSALPELIPHPATSQPSWRSQEALQETETFFLTPFISSLGLNVAQAVPPLPLHDLRHASREAREQQGSTLTVRHHVVGESHISAS